MAMGSRGFIEGDERNIFVLFSKVYGKEIGEPFWRWRYIENPCGKGIIRLMFDGERLVGHYAVIPMKLWKGDGYCRAAFSMTTMTHPGYEGRGIFTTLAKETYNACEGDGIDIVYGFPNPNSYYGFTSKLGWKGGGNVEGWSLPEDSGMKTAGAEFAVGEPEHFGDEHAALWEKTMPEGKVMVPRDPAFLNWRYFDKPDGEYRVFEIRDGGGALCGFTVSKVYDGKAGRVGHIIDMSFLQDRETQVFGIAQAVLHLRSMGAGEVTCWRTADELSLRFPEMGFERKTWPTFFGVRVARGRERELAQAAAPANWILTMGDSDVF